MRICVAPLVVSIFLFAGPSRLLHAEADQKQDASSLPGIDPLPLQDEAMSQEKLDDFFEHQKKGAPLQLTLDRGKVVKGLFSSYDDYYETVWLVMPGERGLFKDKGYKVSGIRNVVPWAKEEASVKGSATFEQMSGDDYYLMKQDSTK